MMRRTLCIAVAALLAGGNPALAQEAMDYAKPESWLCRPDANGPCDTDLALTAFEAGKPVELPALPAADARVDCFYVYPTVSRAEAGNSDGTVTDAERYVVRQQFARFVDVCRRFAPMYRQATLAALLGKAPGDLAMAYADVKAAFHHYLAHDNGGRGVILIGHSQGALHLGQLIAREIVGKPVEGRIIAAYVIGFPVAVADAPDAKAPPGLPPCTRADQVGCMLAYASFAAGQPPAPEHRFVAPPGPGLKMACVSPARLLETPFLTAIMPARPQPLSTTGAMQMLAPGPVETPFYQLGGSIKGECLRGEGGTSYLSVSSDDAGLMKKLETMSAALPGWGLHLVDVNLAQGSLIALAKRQADAWLARARAAR